MSLRKILQIFSNIILHNNIFCIGSFSSFSHAVILPLGSCPPHINYRHHVQVLDQTFATQSVVRGPAALVLLETLLKM